MNWGTGWEERSRLGDEFDWDLGGNWFNKFRNAVGLVWNGWLNPLGDGWQVGWSRNFNRMALRPLERRNWLRLRYFESGNLRLGHFEGWNWLGLRLGYFERRNWLRLRLGLGPWLNKLDDLLGVEVGLRCWLGGRNDDVLDRRRAVGLVRYWPDDVSYYSIVIDRGLDRNAIRGVWERRRFWGRLVIL